MNCSASTRWIPNSPLSFPSGALPARMAPRFPARRGSSVCVHWEEIEQDDFQHLPCERRTDGGLLSRAIRTASGAPTGNAAAPWPRNLGRRRSSMVGDLVPRQPDVASGDHPHRHRRGGAVPLCHGDAFSFRIVGRLRLDAARGRPGLYRRPLDAIDLLLFHGALAVDRLSRAVPVLLRSVYGGVADAHG